MKKLIFTAFVAVFAIGGAYATTYYNAAGDVEVICSDLGTSCILYPNQPLYTTDAGSAGPEANPDRLAEEFFQ